MENHTTDQIRLRLIEDASHTIFNYCMARTHDRYDAEELSQEILCELSKSSGALRDDDAFYGFMWAVAGNVYRQWIRRRTRQRTHEIPQEHAAELSDTTEFPSDNDDDGLINRLRRELGLLGERHRTATVLYYVKNRSCAQIAEDMGISVSMVKYLLFKSRKILTEGIAMERKLGEMSYAPRKLKLLFWGQRNTYYNCAKTAVAQSILFACNEESLTAQQISLEIGVSLPYIEGELDELVNYGLLGFDGKRYRTDIVIFTDRFSTECRRRTADQVRRIAEQIKSCADSLEADIRRIGFYGCDMPLMTYRWQIMSILMYRAVIEKLSGQWQLDYPTDKFGQKCFVWASEDGCRNDDFCFGISYAQTGDGDLVRFMDYPINGPMVHHYFDGVMANVLCSIARGNADKLNENDLTVAAELVIKGCVTSDNGKLTSNVPVFTGAQMDALNTLLDKHTDDICRLAAELAETVEAVLRDHIPSHLAGLAHAMTYFRLFEDAVSAPAAALYEDGWIVKADAGGMLSTTYIILGDK